MEKHERKIGIELLRIIFTFMICMQHVLNMTGVFVNCVTTFEYYWYSLIKILSYSSVGGYALISGFVNNSKSINIKRIISFWLQTWFYSLVVAACVNLLLGNQISMNSLINDFFPITNNAYWYSRAYFILLFFIPFINKGLDVLDKKNSFILFVLIIIFMSAAWFVKGDDWLESCYSPIWIMIMYIVGGLLKRANIFEKINNYILFSTFLFMSLLTFAVFFLLNSKIFYGRPSPTMVVASICMVVMFSRFNFKSNIILKISSLTYGIYLFHLCGPVWKKLWEVFVFNGNWNIATGTAFCFGVCTLIFVISAIMELIRMKLFELSKINVVIEKTANKLTNCINQYVK